MQIDSLLRRSIYALHVVMALLVSVLCSIGTSSVAHAAEQYRDVQDKFTFTLPEGWQKETRGADAIFISPDATEEFIVASGPAGGSTLEQWTGPYSAWLMMHEPGYQADPAGVQDQNLGDTPAKWFAYESTGDPRGAHSAINVFAVREDTIYILRFEAFPSEPKIAMSPALEMMLDSWQFTNLPVNTLIAITKDYNLDGSFPMLTH